MTYLKILTTLNSIILVIIIVAIFYGWLKVQGVVSAFSALGGSGGAPVSSTSSTEEGTSDTSGGETTVVPNERKPIVIRVSDLPESQQQMLRSLGFTAETYTITAEMQVCAEGKVGAARLDAMAAGATPTGLEAAALVACM